jgi:hypothetical protein
MRKEIPILYSTDMVKAKLEGIKSETRRTRGLKVINEHPDQWERLENTLDHFRFMHKESGIVKFIHPPWGKPGDLMYVRENWRVINWDYESGCIKFQYEAGGNEHVANPPDDADRGHTYWIFKQQELAEEKGAIQWINGGESSLIDETLIPFKPSIHLPKFGSRIWDEVVDIELERLQDITKEGAINEGIKRFKIDGKTQYQIYGTTLYTECPIESYRSLWNKINGNGEWEKNPWVWVIKTKTLSLTGKPE